MTQIILVLKHQYILMASDRRLTSLDEKKGIGKVLTDEECKLVALCDHSAISFTGLACLDGMPTHIWIASILKKYLCMDGFVASDIIRHEASVALKKIKVSNKIKHCTFLVTGYQEMKNGDIFPYCIRISNAYSSNDGSYLREASEQFTIIPYVLPKNEDSIIAVIGQPLDRSQSRRLEKNLGKVEKHGNSAVATLRLLKDEIIVSSNMKMTVGKKILGLCITKKSVELSRHREHSFLVGGLPINSEMSMFTYFEEGYNNMIQYGPTYVCGNSASTDLTVKNTESTISVSMRVL
ncbi:hypothetical protein [Cellvibrio sp.]